MRSKTFPHKVSFLEAINVNEFCGTFLDGKAERQWVATLTFVPTHVWKMQSRLGSPLTQTLRSQPTEEGEEGESASSEKSDGTFHTSAGFILHVHLGEAEPARDICQGDAPSN